MGHAEGEAEIMARQSSKHQLLPAEVAKFIVFLPPKRRARARASTMW